MALDPWHIESVSFLYFANFSSLSKRVNQFLHRASGSDDVLGSVLIHPRSESGSSDLGPLWIDDSKPVSKITSVSVEIGEGGTKD